jgi:hypothetical protein
MSFAKASHFSKLQLIGTPSNVIDRLNTAAVEALADPAVRSRLGGLGMEVLPRERQTPEALGEMVKADAEPLVRSMAAIVEAQLFHRLCHWCGTKPSFT